MNELCELGGNNTNAAHTEMPRITAAIAARCAFFDQGDIEGSGRESRSRSKTALFYSSDKVFIAICAIKLPRPPALT